MLLTNKYIKFHVISIVEIVPNDVRGMVEIENKTQTNKNIK